MVKVKCITIFFYFSFTNFFCIILSKGSDYGVRKKIEKIAL